MKKFGRTTIDIVLQCAVQEFLEDPSAPDFISFWFNGHLVTADYEWSHARARYFVSRFSVTYKRCVMSYSLGDDFDLSSAWCW